jgi:hypothetical protein
MSRLGCALDDGAETTQAIQHLKNLELKGIYSHLACADDRNITVTQAAAATLPVRDRDPPPTGQWAVPSSRQLGRNLIGTELALRPSEGGTCPVRPCTRRPFERLSCRCDPP